MLQENMTRMLMVTDVHDIIKRHQAQIITSLKDPDIRFNSSFLCQCTSKSRMAGLSDVVAHSFAWFSHQFLGGSDSSVESMYFLMN